LRPTASTSPCTSTADRDAASSHPIRLIDGEVQEATVLRVQLHAVIGHAGRTGGSAVRAGSVDRQVTQPSSFSNSLIGVSITVSPRSRNSCALCGASDDISTVLVEDDDGRAVLLRHGEELRVDRRVVDERR
jgi:hypothetical protein